jgi:hypothetical protein
LHARAGHRQGFAGDAKQALDSSSDPGDVPAPTAGSPGAAGLLREAYQHVGIH